MADAPRRRTRPAPAQASAPGAQRTDPMAGMRAFAGMINGEFGEGSMRPANVLENPRQVPFRIFLLDLAFSGGLPEGQMSMFYGPEAGGKTTMAMRIVASYQQKYPDRAALWLDSEQTYSPQWAEAQGVDAARMYYARMSRGEDMVDAMHAAMDVPELGIMVLDSVPATVPIKDAKDSAADALVATLARLMGRMCSHYLAKQMDRNTAGQHPVTFIVINQWRFKVGGLVLGDPRTLPGGQQLKYTASTHLEIKNKPQTGKDSRGVEINLANNHSFVIKRSKIGNTIRTGEFVINTDPASDIPVGDPDDYDAIITYGKRLGIISGGGTLRADVLGDASWKGNEALADHLFENPEAKLRLMRAIISSHRVHMRLPELPPDGFLLGNLP